jgi:hypothetical protein
LDPYCQGLFEKQIVNRIDAKCNCIADDDFLVGHIEPDAEIDILISLGDLYDVTLQKAIDLYAPEHVIAVRRNHCVDAA